MNDKQRIINKAQRHLLVLVVLALGCLFVFSTFVFDATRYARKAHYQPPERSREELYQDIFISLLLPYVQNEIDRYYSTYLTYLPMVAPYTVYVASAERLDGYRSFLFRLKLLVESYVGAHNSVGLDYITVTVSGSGDVKVEKFEHIKSYMLPPNYEDIIREGYHNPIP